jgi:hypothetical protein
MYRYKLPISVVSVRSFQLPIVTEGGMTQQRLPQPGQPLRCHKRVPSVAAVAVTFVWKRSWNQAPLSSVKGARLAKKPPSEHRGRSF